MRSRRKEREERDASFVRKLTIPRPVIRDPLLNLRPEVLHKTLDRPSSSVSERADSVTFDLLGELEKHVDFSLGASTFDESGDRVEDERNESEVSERSSVGEENERRTDSSCSTSKSFCSERERWKVSLGNFGLDELEFRLTLLDKACIDRKT